MPSPSALTQLLLGSFRDWGLINTWHVALSGTITFVLVCVYLLCVRERLQKFEDAKNSVAKHSLRATRGAYYGAMSQKMYHGMMGETHRMTDILRKELRPESLGQLGCGDPGWGTAETHVHHNTSIAKSYILLEEKACARRPHLRHRNHRTIRDYVGALKETFPALRRHKKLCDEYISAYEQAVFSSHHFTSAEYEHFMSVIRNMVALINDKPLSEGGEDDQGQTARALSRRTTFSRRTAFVSLRAS